MLVGELARPLLGIISCVHLEGVDHCLNFLSGQLAQTPLRNPEARDIGNFFFLVTRNGTEFRVNGDPNPVGTVVRSQFPPPGVLLTPGAVITLDF